MSERTHTPLRQEYDAQGFAIVRNAIDAGLAAEMVAHVHFLRERHPDLRPELLHHGLVVDEPFMHRIATDDRLVELAAQILGPDVALYAAHYIAKPPRTGRAMPWHQDGWYWKLEPPEATTLWIAATRSTVASGCMRVLPGTQANPFDEHRKLVELDAENLIVDIGIHPDRVDAAGAVDVELEPGDVSIHTTQIVHASNANTSDEWRIGLTLRCIPTGCRVNTANHRNILMRGRADPRSDNAYAERPEYVPGRHLPFAGCETWNDPA